MRPLVYRFCLSAFATGIALAEPSFERDILPLLMRKCYECHSHEAGKMKGGLTLDSRAGWAEGGDSGPAILPGDAAKSLLIQAVRRQDPDFAMPPKEALSAAEVESLVQWVNAGAPDPRTQQIASKPDANWWSLKPLQRPTLPPGAHPIDAFVHARLAAHALQPAPPADRHSLIRRLYLDLHGLLPTPAEVDAFVKDPDPQAWEKRIDALLSSPRYGERWARHWLDVIHFADSHGCEHDVKRPNAWRYRDYVIERLNADVPWARFIREQLAADHFFPDEPQLTAALGFIAAGPLELSRAGTAPVTFDYLDRDDMVTQTMAAFVSTTANCARCHTHKFDPVSQEDYYALQAVFAGIGKGDVAYDPSPEVMRQRQEWNAVLAAAKARDASVLLQEKYRATVRDWEAGRSQQPLAWTPLDPEVFVADGATLTKEDDGSIFAGGDLKDEERYTLSTEIGLQRLTALRLDACADKRLPEGGPGRAGNGNLHLSEVEVLWFAPGAKTGTPIKIARASADFDQAGWTSMQAIDGDRKSGWAIHPMVNQSHFIVFELAAPIEVIPGGKLVVTLHQLFPPKHFIGRFRLSATDAPASTAWVLPPATLAALAKPADQRNAGERALIAAAALEPHAQQKLATLPPQVEVYGASSSWSHAKKLPSPQAPKVVHLLQRGAIDKPLHEVGPGALSSIPGLAGRFELADPQQEALRRAALADWLAHPENPLTWRSIVNRVWHFHFGSGICDTPNDFGRMGGEPSHPELLDWLALWFRDEAKGSLKALHKLILTSATWQQSSRVADNTVDAENRLLWRMNRRRLDAEAFRDTALQMAGRLDLRMGGPGIEQFAKSKGPQATPALDYSAYEWNSESARRRSIYRVVWRGIPDPFMEALDFPDLALLTPKRGFSVSALQSLALYNNDFVLHGAEWLAAAVGDQGARRAVQLLWQREPTDDELVHFQRHAEAHGIAALCRVLLNSNEFLFVD